MAKKYECDKCGEIVSLKKIWGLEICEIEEDGNYGSSIFDIDICDKCKKEVIDKYGKKKTKNTLRYSMGH